MIDSTFSALCGIGLTAYIIGAYLVALHYAATTRRVWDDLTAAFVLLAPIMVPAALVVRVAGWIEDIAASVVARLF